MAKVYYTCTRCPFVFERNNKRHTLQDEYPCACGATMKRLGFAREVNPWSVAWPKARTGRTDCGQGKRTTLEETK